jgi:hypothetical protein
VTQTTIDPTLVQHITGLAQALASAVKTGDSAQILTAQQNLSHAAEVVWARYDNETHSGKDKAVARLLADMAMRDLPQEIQDPANYPQILHKLRLLKNSLVLLN